MKIKEIFGRKWRKEYYTNLIQPYLPTDIKTYVDVADVSKELMQEFCDLPITSPVK
jgi:hypothetical protein